LVNAGFGKKADKFPFDYGRGKNINTFSKFWHSAIIVILPV